MDEPDTQLPARMRVERSARRLRIAVVYSRLPFPMHRGDQLTVAHLIAFLSERGHEADLITLDMGGELDRRQWAWLGERCRDVTVFPQPRWRQALGVLSSLITLRPLQVGLFSNARLDRLLDTRLRRGDYDIVYVYYLRSAYALRARFEPGSTRTFSGTPVAAFLAMQLSQTLNTRRIFENQRPGPTKLAYGLEWRLLRRAEARLWRRFTHTLLIGEKDVEAVRRACEDERQPVISNWKYGAHGTDLSRFRVAAPAETVADRIVFSGSMFYEPNCQAALWFVRSCWAAIREAVPNATLYFVGRDPVREIRALHGSDGITVTGTVADVGEYIRSARVCINPMLAAGGMQNKLIEYLASGVPVVATSVANEGIRAPDGEALLIRDGAEPFVAGVLDVLRSPELAGALGRAGRHFVEQHWTWEAHFLRLEANFLGALEAEPVASANAPSR